MASSINKFGLCTINDEFGLCESDPVASLYDYGPRAASLNFKDGLHAVTTKIGEFGPYTTATVD